MLSPQALCLRCRAQGNGIGGAVRILSSSKKFSSISHSTRNLPQNARAATARPLVRLSRPRPIEHPFSRPGFPGSIPQIRFQSSIVDAANNVLGDPATASHIEGVTSEHSIESITSHLEAGGSWEIGFLANSGLDFGWGPTSMMMWAFEHIHVYTGLSVGATIVVLAMSWRLALFPLSMGAAEMGTQMRRIQPQLKAVQLKNQKAMVSGDEQEKAKAQREYKSLLKKEGIEMKKMFYPLVQIPLGFAQWRLLRNMAFLPAPGMATGGFLWFPNLIIHDPFFALPIATAAMQYLAVTVGGGGDQAQVNPQMQKFMQYGLPTITFVVTAAAPSAVQLSFFVGAFCALLQNLVLRSDIGRSLLGLTPRPRNQGDKPVQSPYKGTITIDPAVRERAVGKKPADQAESGSRTMTERIRGALNIRKHVTNMQTAVGKAIPMLSSTSKDSTKKWESRKAKQRDEDLHRKRAKQREEQKLLWEQEHGQRPR